MTSLPCAQFIGNLLYILHQNRSDIMFPFTSFDSFTKLVSIEGSCQKSNKLNFPLRTKRTHFIHFLKFFSFWKFNSQLLNFLCEGFFFAHQCYNLLVNWLQLINVNDNESALSLTLTLTLTNVGKFWIISLLEMEWFVSDGLVFACTWKWH